VSLEEVRALAHTAGYEIIEIFRTRYRNRIGSGLLERISYMSEEADTIIFYGNPSPSTVFQLMKATRKPVVDRVQLILEIFARHAGSREAKLQIEMARIKHELPLVREYIRRSKMGEYPGFLGPGRYAVDAYYRHLTSKLARIRRQLEKLKDTRRLRRNARRRLGLPQAAIVGYASAGKTSIFNALSGESKPVGEEYFTTLHPKHKLVTGKHGRIVLVDTVGFIRDIPPEIIEAFYATLEEIVDSDTIIFVVDISEPLDTIREKVVSGLDIMARIGAVGKPVIVAANKMDLTDPSHAGKAISIIRKILDERGIENTVIPVSAMTGEGLERLLEVSTKKAYPKSLHERG